MTDFPNLFSPFQLGGISLKNRLVALPTGTSMVQEGVPTDGDLAYFERLAAGGVGLVISGATVVHPTSTLRSRKLVEADHDEFISAISARAEVIHRHGARFIGQLCHLGREFIGGESDSPPVAPSPVKTVRDAYAPHELSVAEIDDIIEGWRVSTGNLVSAGADGMEIHAAHGYLPAQFLSPLTNQRTDEFGGCFDNRLRFLRLVIEAARSVMRPGFLLGVRLSGVEDIAGGMGADDCVRIAEFLAGLDVNYLSITHGTRGTYVKDSTGPDAIAVPSASRVRAATGIPVLVGQRINDVGTAERVIQSGQADLVGMARALIADPELPVKAGSGRVAEVRPCIGINQDCRAFDPHLYCAVNAEVGRGAYPNVGHGARSAKQVYVIGGGPAGLEAARIAARRGFRVTLFEQQSSLGGAVRVAASSPNRGALIDIVDYLHRELRRMNVEINLSAAVDETDLKMIVGRVDHVVLATGSRSGELPMELTHRPAATVEQVLLNDLPPVSERTAVVYDESDGFWPAYSAAEALAQRGWQVTLATGLTSLAPRVPAESSGPLLARLGSAGVDLRVGQQLIADRDPGAPLRLSPIYGGTAVPVRGALTVWHQPRVPRDWLAGSLAGNLDRAAVCVIGDCVTPRRIGHAIAEGYRAAAAI